jgi:hypothetical protein
LNKVLLNNYSNNNDFSLFFIAKIKILKQKSAFSFVKIKIIMDFTTFAVENNN